VGERKEDRGKTRYPFFRPLTIRIGDNRIPGFSREVSEVGIGLLHAAELAPGEFELAIPTQRGYLVHVRTSVLWCTACGQGWFISGGEFIGISRIGT
jgi:hypothetical protein